MRLPIQPLMSIRRLFTRALFLRLFVTTKALLQVSLGDITPESRVLERLVHAISDEKEAAAELLNEADIDTAAAHYRCAISKYDAESETI